jgi:hypothetical protein
VKPHRAARSIADLEDVLERVQGISAPAAVDATPAPSAMPIPATGDLRVEAAAAYLSQRLGRTISAAMMRNWRFRGYFPASYKAEDKHASPIYFRRDELDAFEPPVRDRWGVATCSTWRGNIWQTAWRIIMDVQNVEEQQPLLITMAHAERILSLDDNSIRKLLAAGEIQAIKIGRSLRIVYQSIIDYIERKRND